MQKFAARVVSTAAACLAVKCGSAQHGIGCGGIQLPLSMQQRKMRQSLWSAMQVRLLVRRTVRVKRQMLCAPHVICTAVCWYSCCHRLSTCHKAVASGAPFVVTTLYGTERHIISGCIEILHCMCCHCCYSIQYKHHLQL
jgi:hypothetical protein